MTKLSGKVGRMGVLDLTWAESPEDLAEIESIERVGVVRVPEALYRHVLAIPMERVGVIESVPSGNMQEMTGLARVGGAFLAGGASDKTLMVSGMLFITSVPESVGFKEIRVMGMLVAPQGSEEVLGTRLGSVKGNVFYYDPAHGLPRLITGNETLTAEFLELLPEAQTFIVAGLLTVEEGVTVDLLRAKVAEVVLAGKIVAPPALHAILQVLTTQKMGSIVAPGQASAEAQSEGDEGDHGPFGL